MPLIKVLMKAKSYLLSSAFISVSGTYFPVIREHVDGGAHPGLASRLCLLANWP